MDLVSRPVRCPNSGWLGRGVKDLLKGMSELSVKLAFGAIVGQFPVECYKYIISDISNCLVIAVVQPVILGVILPAK